MLSPKDFHELYMSVYEGMDPEERALKRELAADKRASKMAPKVGAKYASSEGQSAARADKKSKGKHIHGTVDESAIGDRAKNAVADQRLNDAQSAAQKSVSKATAPDPVTRTSATNAAKKSERTARSMHPKPGIGAYRIGEANIVYGGEKKEPEDKRMTVTAADKKANTPAYQKFKAGNPAYKAAPHLDEDIELDEEKKELPQNKMYRKAGNLGREVVSSRKGPKRDAAMKRMNKIVSTITRETERKRFDEIGKSPAHNEEFEIAEDIRNPERREKLRSIMDKSVRKGDKSKGENPRQKYHTKTGKQALGLLHGGSETGSPKAPVRSRGGGTVPSDERVVKSHRASNREYWAGVSGPSRDRGAGNKAARRAAALKKEELKLELIAHLRERALDAAEKREKEHVFKAIKPSSLAKTYPEKSPKELKSLRYAISTSQAKKNMDTSKSDKRYGVER